MIELKATTAQEIVRNEKDCDYMDELFGGVKMPPTQVYIKSEADKVIAELEKDVEAWIGSFEASRRVNARTESKLRHSNYKRCLAMAMWCESENYTDCWYHENSERCKWTEKWHKRWLKIAEKFKNKETE